MLYKRQTKEIRIQTKVQTRNTNFKKVLLGGLYGIFKTKPINTEFTKRRFI